MKSTDPLASRTERLRFIQAPDRPSVPSSGAKQLVLIGEAREELCARLGDQDLVLELDTLPAALLADIALDADDHARQEMALPAIGGVVHGMGDEGRLAMHAHAM